MNEKPTEVKELEKKYAIKKGISAMQAVENELNHMLDDLQRYKRWFNEAQNLHKKRESIESVTSIFNRGFSSHSLLISAIVDLTKAGGDDE